MIDRLRSFGRLSWGLQAAWALLAVAGVALFAISAKFRAQDPTAPLLAVLTEMRRESAAQHQEILEAIRDLSNVRIGTLDFPPPNPEHHFDGIVVIIDMTGAKSADDPKAAEASKLFSVVDDEDSLVQLVLSGRVRIVQLRLLTPDPTEAKGGVLPKYAVELQIHNLTDAPVTTTVPRGQVFENTTAGTGFQNLATADAARVSLAPNELKHVRILAYCINRGRRQPNNRAGYLTPLKIKFDFANQETLWAEIGSRVPAANTPR